MKIGKIRVNPQSKGADIRVFNDSKLFSGINFEMINEYDFTKFKYCVGISDLFDDIETEVSASQQETFDMAPEYILMKQ